MTNLIVADYAISDCPVVAKLAYLSGFLFASPRFFEEIALATALPQPAVMTPAQMKDRTKAFATQIVNLARKLPRDVASVEIARQIIKSGTSVAANYRSSCRAKSKADFISKMTTVEEEADETLLWLELLVSTETVKAVAAAALLDEADQIVRIVVASINTARGNTR
jgi:four helix bundle protein